eukprot:m.97184 g.97184  ORF g.97184 m.97184 type:complete len:209 (+) comp20509_c0_seq1:55-681(+)
MPAMRGRGKGRTKGSNAVETGSESEDDASQGGSGGLNEMQAMMKTFNKPGRNAGKNAGGGDKAKLTKASKEIAKDTRQAIELFMQQKAEEDASKHSEIGQQLLDLTGKCKSNTHQLLRTAEDNVSQTQEIDAMFVKTVAEYKKMSLRHTGEIEEITERQNEEAREVSETAIKSGFRSCRKDVEAEQQAQATKNADGLNAVMQMLMTLQ